MRVNTPLNDFSRLILPFIDCGARKNVFSLYNGTFGEWMKVCCIRNKVDIVNSWNCCVLLLFWPLRLIPTVLKQCLCGAIKMVFFLYSPCFSASLNTTVTLGEFSIWILGGKLHINAVVYIKINFKRWWWLYKNFSRDVQKDTENYSTMLKEEKTLFFLPPQRDFHIKSPWFFGGFGRWGNFRFLCLEELISMLVILFLP